MARPVTDDKWAQTAFLLPKHAGNLRDARNRLFSDANLRFTDTSPGGSFEINPPPQLPRTADLRVSSKFASPRDQQVQSRSLTSNGVGRKYATTIADNSQLIHLRAGVAQFNSITTFFTGFFDGKAAILSKTGRAPGFFYYLGRATGFVVTLPLAPIILIGQAYRLLTDQPSGQFYYLKPTMPLYWQSVNTILNGILATMGFIPRVFSTDANAATGQKLDDKVKSYNSGNLNPDPSSNPTSGDLAIYHKYFPDIFQPGGGIDAYALANRAQRMADVSRKRAIEAAATGGSLADLRGKMSEYAKEKVTDPGGAFGGKASLDAYLAAWEKTDAAKPDYSVTDPVEKAGSWFSSFVDFAIAEARDGGQFLTLRVNHTGTADESFGSTSQESALKQSINGTSADMRSKMFDLSGGNIGDGPIASTLEASVNSVKDFAFGVMDSFNVSGLRALAGAAFVDIPEMWADSFAQLPTMSYTMECRSWSGDPLSRVLNLWLPVSCVLALALPKSVGKAAYDSPFLLELYDKGRAQTRLGLLKSANFRRGVGNVGWTREQQPLGIDISFEIASLSTSLAMPINASPGIFDHDNPFNDYLAVLGSMSMVEQIESWSRVKINLTRKMQAFQEWKSPARWASVWNGTVPGQVVSALSRSTDRP